MQRCWQGDPARRPMFQYIVRYLKDELARVKRQRDRSMSVVSPKSAFSQADIHVNTSNFTANNNNNYNNNNNVNNNGNNYMELGGDDKDKNPETPLSKMQGLLPWNRGEASASASAGADGGKREGGDGNNEYGNNNGNNGGYDGYDGFGSKATSPQQIPQHQSEVTGDRRALYKDPNLAFLAASPAGKSNIIVIIVG